MSRGVRRPDKPMDASLPQSQAENGAWQNIHGVWRQIHGSYAQDGASIEWHDFRLDQALQWHPSFHAQSLEICLNYSGTATFGTAKTQQALTTGKLAAYSTGSHPLEATRSAEHTHRFLTFEFSNEFLLRELQALMDGLKPGIRQFLDKPNRDSTLLELREFAPHLLTLRSQILEPPVPKSALSLWYAGKITELLASLLFAPGTIGELFCQQQKRLNRERCEHVLFLLKKDMENPPSLQMLADEVDCSPFHLSRLFAMEMGVNIPKALRKLRIEKAAASLLDSHQSVTEIAMRVGYSSLGAFNKAFSDAKGCSPGKYRQKHHKESRKEQVFRSQGLK